MFTHLTEQSGTILRIGQVFASLLGFTIMIETQGFPDRPLDLAMALNDWTHSTRACFHIKKCIVEVLQPPSCSVREERKEFEFEEGNSAMLGSIRSRRTRRSE